MKQVAVGVDPLHRLYVKHLVRLPLERHHAGLVRADDPAIAY